MWASKSVTCPDPESIFKGGPTLTFFFWGGGGGGIDEGREDPNTTIRGPSSSCQRNTIKWGLVGVPIMAQH